jgi:hypothetical protein
MKTSIKNLFAAVLGLVISTSTVFANEIVKSSNYNAKVVTVLKEVKNIKKLVVSGNVEVNLVQTAEDGVSVYDNYYAKNALVQQKDGVLRISSFEATPLTVTVYVRNLSTIEANDNAIVKTDSKLKFLSLDVLLKGNAKAEIVAQTVSLFTSVKDNASLTLMGSTEEHIGVIGTSANVSTGQFIASSSFVRSVAPVYNAQTKAVVTLEGIASQELAK